MEEPVDEDYRQIIEDLLATLPSHKQSAATVKLLSTLVPPSQIASPSPLCRTR